jgi:hypothetical protein
MMYQYTNSNSTMDSIKTAIDQLNEEETCSIIEHIAKKIWIPIHIPRERFDIPCNDYQALIDDKSLTSKVNDFICYLLQNRFDNLESETDATSTTSSKEDAVAEVEFENDNNMTVESLIDMMCSHGCSHECSHETSSSQDH